MINLLFFVFFNISSSSIILLLSRNTRKLRILLFCQFVYFLKFLLGLPNQLKITWLGIRYSFRQLQRPFAQYKTNKL
jgi:hypothetical protein